MADAHDVPCEVLAFLDTTRYHRAAPSTPLCM